MKFWEVWHVTLSTFYDKYLFLILHYCIILYKSICCDISNFSEFYQDYESASYILFGENWFFSILSHNTRLLFEQPIVVYSILLNISGLNQSQESDFSTYFILSTDCEGAPWLILANSFLLVHFSLFGNYRSIISRSLS